MDKKLKRVGLFISCAGAFTLCQTIVEKREDLRGWVDASVNNHQHQGGKTTKQIKRDFIKKLGKNAYSNAKHWGPVFLGLEYYNDKVLKHPFKFPWLSS